MKKLIGPLTLSIGSFSAACLYVIKNGGFGSGDLWAFFFWSVIAGLISFPFLALFSKLSTNKSKVVSYALACILGPAYSYFWTWIMSLVFGPMLLAFSFPIFACWTFGSTFAFLMMVIERNGLSWLPAFFVSAVVSIAVISGIRKTEKAPPPDVRVILKPGVSSNQVEKAWKLFETPVTRTPDGYNPEGIAGTGGWDSNGQHGFRLTFHANSDSIKRDAMLNKIAFSPVVEEVKEAGFKDKKYFEKYFKKKEFDSLDVNYLEIDSTQLQLSIAVLVLDSIVKLDCDKYCWFKGKVIKSVKNPYQIKGKIKFTYLIPDGHWPSGKPLVYFDWYNAEEKTGLKLVKYED
jgi:hypothetical protein